MSYFIKKSSSNKGTFSAVRAEKTEATSAKQEVSEESNLRNPIASITAANNSGFRLSLESKDLLNGIILSEVLGKPKCMRKGR